ncbi:hypothetical protein GGS26DRAFT_338401 [Hypomontagnella submonticulosa]|nr:hypothetical protein GGS26DRAFT_338401 [Hypomontagnella submonticulosa]
MRLVSIIIRDVKPKCFALHPRFAVWSQRPQIYIRKPRLSTHGYGQESRSYFSATTSLDESVNPIDVLLSGLSDDIQEIRRAATQQQRTGDPPPLIQKTELFGKWRALLTDPSRLAVETDFNRRGPAKIRQRRLLVDKFENRGDLALWSCLLDYQKRVNGDSGVATIWKGLWGRKTLYDIQSPLAPVFWQTILEAAVRSKDHKFLSSIWVYSEWMYDTHGVKWPHLYSTVLSHFLRTHQHQQALQWQLRLTPNFYPGADEFASIVKQHVDDRELYRAPTLESLYIVNPDHQLYDTLVPYLYDQGASQLAAKWRRICIRHDDVPLTSVSVRPFLRFLQGYFPHQSLHPDESAAIGDSKFDSVDDAGQIEISREFVNRVHGGTFGISVKKYNDRLGAKWLASSWVSLDIAISTISTLGIDQIGPLSLQSIALREGTSEGVLSRIEQLNDLGISIVDSNYLRLVLHLAKAKDNELLLDLLHSDLHPDVFDDNAIQARLVISTAKSEDWRTHRLMLASRLVAMENSVREVANALARGYILRKDKRGLSKLLDDMKNMGITIDSDQTSLIFDGLVTEAKSTFLPADALYFYLPICRQLAAMEIPVPVRCWRKILFCLARQDKIDDLEKICIELVELFISSQSSRPGFVPVHPEDLPESMRKPLSGVANLLGVYIPLDLPSRIPLHPLRQIFDNKMLGTIVRCSFHSLPNRRNRAVPTLQLRHQPSVDFNGSRVIRLLRMLRNRGLFLDKERLATWVKLRLITLYGPGNPTKRTLQVVRASNILSLSEMKSLLDAAWGEELLPPLEKLQAEIETRGHKVALRNKEYLQAMGKTTPQPRVVL